MGEQPDEDLITRVIDQIILPAATCCTAPTTTNPSPSPSHMDSDKEQED